MIRPEQMNLQPSSAACLKLPSNLHSFHSLIEGGRHICAQCDSYPVEKMLQAGHTCHDVNADSCVISMSLSGHMQL